MRVTCASYNVKVRRPSARVVAFLKSHPEVDVWFLQESHGYRRALAKIPGFTLHAPEGFPLSANTALLIRWSVTDTLASTPLPPLRTKRTWPRTRMGGTHPARSFTMAQVGPTRLVSVHMPSIRGPKRGKAQRVAATAECSAALAQLVSDGVPTLLAGDWNARPGELAPPLPAGLALWPSGGIDFAASQGVPVSGVRLNRRGNGGSDHPLVTFTADLPDAPPPPTGWTTYPARKALDAALEHLGTAPDTRADVAAYRIRLAVVAAEMPRPTIEE